MKIENVGKEVVVTEFEESDINEKGQLIVPEGVTKIKVPSRQFTPEIEELHLPKTLKNIIGSISMPNLKKLYMPNLGRGNTHGKMFNRCYMLDYVEIGAGFIDEWTFYHCPIQKVKLTGDTRIYSGYAFAGHSAPVSIEITNDCKNADINLLAVPYVKEIIFPDKFNPNLNIFFAPERRGYNSCSFVVNRLSKENLIQLLAYCPEAYLDIAEETCDAEFRKQAKDAITFGMAKRAQSKGFDNVKEDVALLYDIKSKIKKEELKERATIATFNDAIKDFKKD